MSKYDFAVETAKMMIENAIKEAYKEVDKFGFDVAEVMADAQEELYVDYLESNGFEVIDLDEEC